MAILEGVYSASVIDNRDPENLARVRVRIASLAETKAGLWARLATLMAGSQRGTLFVPEVGDEVLIAFERGDIRQPYVIGSLWNAKSPPPSGGASVNDVKLIRSRNGVTLRILDDANTGKLTLETSGGQRIVLEESPGAIRIEDSSGSIVKLSPTGVEIAAAGTVKIAASAIDLSAAAISFHAGIARFDGVVQCQTLVSDSVVASSYTPGAGNVF
ncbi:MAG TPA: phage baseplate assembly protein V [Burkholderiaceae bacterium]|nr:phage baseplate assembly protein V [Burkholderiaceae bacterium]